MSRALECASPSVDIGDALVGAAGEPLLAGSDPLVVATTGALGLSAAAKAVRASPDGRG